MTLSSAIDSVSMIGEGELMQHLRQDRAARRHMGGLRPLMFDMACAVPAGDEDHRGGANLRKMARVMAGGG